MRVVSLIETKGGVGKTTTAANVGGFVADAGLRVLLLDLDVQPTLSSYFELNKLASAGSYELLAFNERDLEQLVSHTTIPNLDLIASNDDQGHLGPLLLQTPDSRLRLRNLLPMFQQHYDLLLIDTPGTRSVLLEMAVIASDLVVSPVTPEILAAREFRRGTLQLLQDIPLYRNLGIQPPPLHLLINRVHPVSTDARQIQQALRQVFGCVRGVHVLCTTIPAITAYPCAATHQLPVHRFERRKPSRRVAPAGLETMRALACELFPDWTERFAKVNGSGERQHDR
ncbi:hypothetical protein AO268_11525 [Pseudomonas sp. ICMP 8385]|uniref:ParA family protein n=1 Tax=Pseudomonas sp. ICMP 8385 TaxID=1718920 RepID=UPI000C08204B|nr:ParA family protein [Pseudomonas sp. ICMP 8385]PHN53599.1 hypothetical protein AO268_11525 [Pseudomonas sp. ICMP 8385]